MLFSLVGCQINKRIFGSEQEKQNFLIDNLEFEDYSIEQVYIVFDLHNNLNETADCSVRISLSQKDKVVSENEYEIGVVEGNSVKNNRILIDMPQGKTNVNVEPSCAIKQEEQTNEKFFIENLKLKGDSGLTFELHNIENETANCSAKVVMYKKGTLIFEDLQYIGVIEGNSKKYYEMRLKRSMPSGETAIDVLPSCTITK